MNPEAPNGKAVARQRLQAALRAMPAGQAEQASAQIRERLLAQPVWRQASAVLLFVPLTGEPDIWPLAENALRSGKLLALPRHDASLDTYQAAQIRDPAADLVPGRFGIREPRQACPAVPLNRLDFALVPGVGFTVDGVRLGRGKGYFDRLLSAVPGFTCGVAFDFQVVPELPLEPHDIRVNCILTPTRWHLTPGRARF